MSDVIFVAVLLAFFVLCTLYVQLCDRIVGPDDLAIAGRGTDPTLDSQSATMITSSGGTSGEVAA